MPRDPFANYDRWLEQPYIDAAERQADQEWIDENTTYTSDCCDAKLPQEDTWLVVDKRGTDALTVCPKCDMICGIVADVPDLPSKEDYKDYEPDDHDDRDEPNYDINGRCR
ncbi:hypothetical protein UFOVP1537_14 [uncultured Caudovirales phage]|uniref:Uncharacterized protein n=2 Tax=root TaxID=1 RepID=A0A6J5QXT8_9CAUD|nr:hypothetical protein UFOVP825_32 [uncultured Caudovirales phage]CAB4171201.1 hypothetical protein UFOVP915_14 [uncultured Caudovirales phage]CAB4177214.1 hypothetical protein UFOVP1000_31 [uncultured Caudovirales phage]CAB4182514.1 hypothetical protein UFOVP1092_6 [uncultured Caudovirales phage]CAB4187347.1 hypothetical protein UFOVP1152_10 [uncultured Caudovirales phage]